MKATMWISVETALPEYGKYVIARHNRGTWKDNDDLENVNCVVVKLVKGISIEDREKMKKGELFDPDVTHWCKSDGWETSKRSNIYGSSDEDGNNEKPYNWEMFGADSFFGQAITHWHPLPAFPK